MQFHVLMKDTLKSLVPVIVTVINYVVFFYIINKTTWWLLKINCNNSPVWSQISAVHKIRCHPVIFWCASCTTSFDRLVSALLFQLVNMCDNPFKGQLQMTTGYILHCANTLFTHGWSSRPLAHILHFIMQRGTK